VSVAQARLGKSTDAEKTGEEFQRRTESLLTEKGKRRYHYMVGELALARGETARAVEERKQAASMLTARGFSAPRDSHHVPIWFSLASALLSCRG
jgi:hypothetical protein